MAATVLHGSIVEILQDGFNEHYASLGQFHKPTNRERRIMAKYGAESLDCEIGYKFQGNFTICVVAVHKEKNG
jgi:hypothetical protein